MNMLKYEEYFDEYLAEATKEMEQFFEKADVFKENYYLQENLVKKYINPVLSKVSNREKIIDYVGDFIDKHHRELSTSGPVHMFTFSDKDTLFLYELFAIDKDGILELFNEMVEETYYGKLSKPLMGLVTSAPHKLLITAMIICSVQQAGSSTDSAESSYEDIISCGEYLMGFSEYPLMFRKFWRIGVREDIMDYTIEHLPGKFKIVIYKLSTVLEIIKYDMHKSVAFYRKESNNLFMKGVDNVYIDFIYRARNQIKNTFKNINREYRANWEKNATQHSKAGKMDDGNLANQEGYSSNMAAIIENTYSKIITSGVDNRWIAITAQANQVDESNLRTFVNLIYTAKNNKLDRFVENVITAYFMKNPTNTSVGSAEFMNFGISLYKSIATSKNEVYREIRITMNYWMDEIIDISSYYPKGGTTVSNYSRSVFNYMIFMIKYHNS